MFDVFCILKAGNHLRSSYWVFCPFQLWLGNPGEGANGVFGYLPGIEGAPVNVDFSPVAKVIGGFIGAIFTSLDLQPAATAASLL